MIAYKVEARDSAWYVRPGAGEAVPITQGGKPIVLGAGWSPTRVLTDVGPVNVMQLRHNSGRTSVWFLNPDYSVRTNVLGQLAQGEGTEFVDGVMRSLAKAWRELVVLPTPALDDETRRYLELGGGALREVVQFVRRETYMRPTVVAMDAEDSVAVLSNHPGPTPQSRVSAKLAHDLFRRDFLDDSIQAASTGRLLMPSPIDGEDLSTDIGICLTHSTIAYRFTDARYNLTFYVVASLWRNVVVALYFPSLTLLIYASGQAVRLVSDFLGAAVDLAMFDHLIDHAIDLERYLLTAPRAVTYVYSQEHLGHHLWNELTGLRAVATRIPQPQIPDILVIRAEFSEMYGKIDQIFPELAGKLDRTPRSKEALIRFVYHNARCLFYPTSDYVSADLAQRIITLAERDPAVEQDREEAEHLAAQGFLIVMLGLRVENRTLVDSTEFFADVIKVLRERNPRVALVVDGHNGAGGNQLFRSHAEDLTERSPAEVELAIAEALRARFADDENVRVISTVGEPVAASIFWCRRAAFFVTPWGAGLAKYRWICNRRGLVVAGRRFFRHAGPRTVHLYDSPQFMENPTPLNFIAPDDVEDAPDAPLLIGLKDENRVNFTLKPEAIRGRLIQLMLAV